MKYVETDLMKNIIIRHIIDDRKKTEKERGKYFYASEGYMPHNPGDSSCPRQIAYKILGEKETEEKDEMYPVFVLGDLYHDFIQKIFVKEKLATQIEECTIIYDDDGKYYWIRKNENKIIIKVPVELHGRLDLRFEIESSPFIADIKTLNERAWEYLISGGKPKEPHYAQMQLYLHHYKYDKGFLLYVNKSSGDMKEFMLEYDKEYVDMTLNNYKQLYDFIMTKGLPPRHFISGQKVPWQCKYCGFTKACLGLSVQQVRIREYVRYPEEEEMEDGKR